MKEYGISVTTLEEIFIRVGKGFDVDEKEAVIPVAQTSPMLHTSSKKENVDYSTTPSRLIFFDHYFAQLNKRLIYGKRDTQMFICQLILPVVLVTVGLSLLLILANQTQPDLILSPNHYNPTYSASYRNFVPFNIANDEYLSAEASSTVASEVFARFTGGANNEGVYGIGVLAVGDDEATDQFHGCSQGAQPLWNTSNFLLVDAPASEHGAARYGAITMSSLTNLSTLVYNVMINESAIHGVGVYVNLVHSAYLQVKSGVKTAVIVAHNYPLPVTYNQASEAATANGFVTALFLSIAFCFIPSSYASFIVKEKEVKAKFQQIISGVSPF